MQKKISIALAFLLAGQLAIAQEKEKAAPPPPPEPPKVIAVHDGPPPPPPPPAAPAPPAKLPKDYRVFLQKNPSVKNLRWSDGGKTIIIEKKDGSMESYTSDGAGKKSAEALYGKLPKAAPPPPPRVIRKME